MCRVSCASCTNFIYTMVCAVCHVPCAPIDSNWSRNSNWLFILAMSSNLVQHATAITLGLSQKLEYYSIAQCAGLCSHEWKRFLLFYQLCCVWASERASVCRVVIDPFLSQTEFHSYNCEAKKGIGMLQCSRLNICAFKTFFRKFKIDFPLFIQQATRERVCAYVCVWSLYVSTQCMNI